MKVYAVIRNTFDGGMGFYQTTEGIYLHPHAAEIAEINLSIRNTDPENTDYLVDEWDVNEENPE